jgi:hypothetical protein
MIFNIKGMCFPIFIILKAFFVSLQYLLSLGILKIDVLYLDKIRTNDHRFITFLNYDYYTHVCMIMRRKKNKHRERKYKQRHTTHHTG